MRANEVLSGNSYLARQEIGFIFPELSECSMIDAEIVKDSNNRLHAKTAVLDRAGFRFGEKVKVIIVKE